MRPASLHRASPLTVWGNEWFCSYSTDAWLVKPNCEGSFPSVKIDFKEQEVNSGQQVWSNAAVEIFWFPSPHSAVA
jgi:hypothetical protein